MRYTTERNSELYFVSYCRWQTATNKTTRSHDCLKHSKYTLSSVLATKWQGPEQALAQDGTGPRSLMNQKEDMVSILGSEIATFRWACGPVGLTINRKLTWQRQAKTWAWAKSVRIGQLTITWQLTPRVEQYLSDCEKSPWLWGRVVSHWISSEESKCQLIEGCGLADLPLSIEVNPVSTGPTILWSWCSNECGGPKWWEHEISEDS